MLYFRATGSKIKFPGFMKVYVEGSDDGEDEKEDMLPDFRKVTKYSIRILNRNSILHSRLLDIRKQDW